MEILLCITNLKITVEEGGSQYEPFGTPRKLPPEPTKT